MKYLFQFLLLSATLSSAASPAPRSSLHYSFDLHDPAHIHIVLDLPSPRLGLELLVLPDQWAGQTELYKAVSDLHTTTPGASLTQTSNPAHWQLHSSRPGPVTVTYDLSQDWQGPLRHPLEHRALLNPSLFEFTGENGLVVPAIPGSDPVEVSFDFLGLPPGQQLLTSFGTEVHQQWSGPWSSVRNALFTGGQLEVQHLIVEGQPVLLAMHGAWSFGPGEIAPAVTKILSAERRLWSDPVVPYYALVIAPYDDRASGGGGSGFTNMANLFLADRENFTADTASLLAHEAFHHWNPAGLGTVEDTQEVAWFGEGFTTFYQDAVLERAGIITPSEYLARLNSTIRDYLLSPRIHLTNDELQRVSPADRGASQEPYLRGAMIALWLNSEIHAQSSGRNSLTDLMLALRRDHSEPLTADRIFRTTARFVDPPTVASLRRFALEGTAVPVPPGSLGECVAFSQRPAWTFDLGFDAASLRPAGVVRGVEQGSNAYQAGVRDGQLLGGFSLWNGNSEREVTLTLREADGKREKLSFLPRGKLLYIPQAEAVPGCASGPQLPE